MSDCTPELRQLIHNLEGELRETQRRLEDLRRERRMPTGAALFLVLVTALTATLSTGRLHAQSPSQVVGPFTVVDKAGNEMLAVFQGTTGPVLRVGHVNLGTGASGNGYVAVGRASGKEAVGIGQINGSFALRIFDSTGNTVLATVGEAKVGGGVFEANDAAGKIRMLMSGTGELHAVDAGGKTRATMTSDGAFSIRGGTGTTGIVRVYPNDGPVGAVGGQVGGLLGVPGTFIMGFLGNK